MAEELSDLVKGILEELRKTVSVELAVGKPIEIEDKTLIPVFSMGIGSGGGGGEGGVKERGKGYGVGGGGWTGPVALVAVFKGIPGPEGLQVLSLKPPGALAKIVSEAMPLIIKRFIPEEKPAEEAPPEEEKRKTRV
jgi:uncharacterized spore protein YtfJ